MEGTLEELTVLGRGLTAALQRSSAVSSLPSAVPAPQRDIAVCFAFALCFFALNWGTRLLLIEPILRRFTCMRPSHIQKCSQSAMEAVFYSVFNVIGLLLVPSLEWTWPSERWWMGFRSGVVEAMRSDLRCYYLMYASRYAQMAVSLLLEPKRSDFSKMLVHHMATLGLIVISYVRGWGRVGAIIMLIMDVADVPLHLEKACKYLADAQKRRGVWRMLANRFFKVFAVVFFITRILMFLYILCSICFEAPRIAPDCVGPWGVAALVLCIVLLILQLIWFKLILNAITKVAHGQDPDDVRSDDETPPSYSRAGKPVSKWSWLARVITSSAIVALVAIEASGIAANWDSTLADVRALAGSLATMWSGSAAEVAALRMAPPDIPRDRRVFGFFVAVIFVINWGIRLVLVEPYARSAVGLTGPQVAKFAQSCMEAVLYGSFALLGLLVVPSQDFVWPSAKWWMGFADGGHEIMRQDLRCYYILYVARYSQALVSVLLEAKRKDFVEMLVHHIVTIWVIYVSYVHGWNRVGVVVMVLLDPADVPLHLAKLCKYTFEASDRQVWQFLADRLFEIFGLTFFVTRIALYGYVCWSAHIESSRYFPKGIPEWTCVALLYTLLVLQCYWFTLIVKVAIKLLAGKSVEDIRSDDEDENEASADKKKR